MASAWTTVKSRRMCGSPGCPWVHVNPWLCEPFRHERRDNHFSLRFEPRLATGVVYDVATHIVQLCSVPSDEALLRMLSLLVTLNQTPGSCCATRFLSSLTVVSLEGPGALSH